MGGSTSTEEAVKALADEFTAIFPKVTYNIMQQVLVQG